jgi:hypothetical protein
MHRYVRAVLWVVVVAQVVMGLGFVLGVPMAIDTWPFGERTPLTNIFIGSIYAAAAASTAWCLWMGFERGLAGIALDYLVIFTPFAAYSFIQATGGAEPTGHLFVFAVVSALGALVGLGLLAWSLRRPWRDDRPTPVLVRGSFVVFIGALWIVAAALFAQARVLPWPVSDELSILIGSMFLGASAYFAYGVVQPRWENAGGQLAGFLAYDVVLIVPFVVRLPDVADEFRLSLIVYTAVVVYSGLLAAYFLFIHPVTRGRRPGPTR